MRIEAYRAMLIRAVELGKLTPRAATRKFNLYLKEELNKTNG